MKPLSKVKLDLLTSEPKTNKKHNLTKNQYQGLKDRSYNPHVVIKKTDRGSAIVVMNTNDYSREALFQLIKRDNFIPIESDPTEQFCSDIRKVLTSMLESDIIDDDTFEFLSVSQARAGIFYLLPKIHKPDIPGRPIYSSNKHPTENIGRFVDYQIQK